MPDSRPIFQDWRLRIFLLSLLLIITLLYLSYSHIIHCETIGLSSFHQIDEKTYVSSAIPEENYEQIQEMLEQSEQRIADFWGDRKGKANIIICSKPEEYEKYCHTREGAGCSLGTFYGNSFIVLNLHGLNTDVISHEMCHNELFERVGWQKTTFQIPQWFNEGLAMMLDYRFVNETDSLRRYKRYVREWELRTRPPTARIRLDQISTLKDFFEGDHRQVTLAYLTSATEVSYWLMFAGREGLQEWERMIKKGDFDSYYQIETSYLDKSMANLPANPVRRLQLQKVSE